MTPYHISINNAHNFRALNFHIAHSIQKYFSNENFMIYSIYRRVMSNASHEVLP